jgi:hypothetical protein
VQGVHSVKERLSVDEPEQRSARSAGRIYFEEVLRYEFVEIPGTQGVRVRLKSSRESRLEIISLSEEAKMRPKIVGFAVESLRVKAFEHSQNILSRRKSKISGGGATTTIGSERRGSTVVRSR